jgi:hypothetical protein
MLLSVRPLLARLGDESPPVRLGRSGLLLSKRKKGRTDRRTDIISLSRT